MRYWAILLIAFCAGSLPKAGGSFAYWHRWRGIRVGRRHWPQVTLGFCTWHLMPPRAARSLAGVVETVARPVPRDAACVPFPSPRSD